VQLKDILEKKHRVKFTKGVLFFHDNALAHWTLATLKKLAYLGFQCLDHPTLFSRSGPVGLPPVPWTEKEMKVRHFSSEEEVIAAAETWLDRKTYEFFFEWLAKVRAMG